MAPEIPGFYWDEEKKKYFKIEQNHTAPAGAAWTVDSVKRRKIQTETDEKARHLLKLRSTRIQRSSVLEVPATGGLLARELGCRPSPPDDVPTAAFASGLEEKGRLSLFPGAEWGSDAANMPAFCVNGQDQKSGLGVVYGTSFEGDRLMASYIPRDNNDRISFEAASYGPYGRWLNQQHHELIHFSGISKLIYHESSNTMVMTSNREGPILSFIAFTPVKSSPQEKDSPLWLLRDAELFQRWDIHTLARTPNQAILDCKAGPPSSDILCVMGTTLGLIQLCSDGRFEWLYKLGRFDPRPPAAPIDILSVDFVPGNHNLLVMGMRGGSLWRADTRVPTSEWQWWIAGPSFGHTAVAHVAAINEYQVVAARLRNQMAVYDLRFCGRGGTGPLEPGSSEGPKPHQPGPGRPTALPAFEFPAYRNAAHLDLGFAVQRDLGLAAAASDDGTVALYSLQSGRRLASPAIDSIRASRPIKALSFESLPGDANPSLFAGIGPFVCKYSFGPGGNGDEWGV